LNGGQNDSQAEARAKASTKPINVVGWKLSSMSGSGTDEVGDPAHQIVAKRDE
jgi:hypothetical protein